MPSKRKAFGSRTAWLPPCWKSFAFIRTCCACAGLVHEELQAVGTAELINWANENAAMFIPTPEVLAEALSIQNQFAGLRDPKAEFDEADAYVIALARMRRGVVVTQETPAAGRAITHRKFLPTVRDSNGLLDFRNAQSEDQDSELHPQR
ncbi:MAG: DUF4411 family protein [Acidobacteria bacterium]|nr:DUF4411 family protein [Acidobacteriota bacterium]